MSDQMKLIEEMRRFGTIHMQSFTDGTCVCNLELFVPRQGITVKLTSGFKCLNFTEAIQLCYGKLVEFSQMAGKMEVKGTLT